MRRRLVIAAIALVAFIVWFVNWLPDDPVAAEQEGREVGQAIVRTIGTLLTTPGFWLLVLLLIAGWVITRRRDHMRHG